MTVKNFIKVASLVVNVIGLGAGLVNSALEEKKLDMKIDAKIAEKLANMKTE